MLSRTSRCALVVILLSLATLVSSPAPAHATTMECSGFVQEICLSGSGFTCDSYPGDLNFYCQDRCGPTWMYTGNCYDINFCSSGQSITCVEY
jgi:hypothetical protein